MRYLIVILMLCVTGCGTLLPEKRTQSVQATENISNAQQLMIESVVESEPINTNTVYRRQLSVKHDGNQMAGATEDVQSSVSLPIAVSMALAAFSLILLAVAAWAMRRSSATGKAADEGVAQLIRSGRAMATSMTDTATKSQLLSLIGDAEATRGKLKR